MASLAKLPKEVFKNDPTPISPTSSFGFVKNILKDKDGAYLYEIEGLSYPQKQLVLPDWRNDIDRVKKLLRMIFEFFSTFPAILIAGVFLILPNFILKPSLKKGLYLFIDFCNTSMGRFFQKPEYLHTPIRNLHTLLVKLFVDKKIFIKPYKHPMILADTICTILWADPPYRFMYQDIAQNIRPLYGFKHPILETWRLLGILKERSYQKRWSQIRLLVVIVLLLKPKLRRLVSQFYREYHPEWAYFDESDLFFCIKGQSKAHGYYKILGLLKEDQEKLLNKILKDDTT